MKRLLILIGVFVVAGSGVGLWQALSWSGSSIPTTKGDITGVSFTWLPEGPPPPPFVPAPTRANEMPLSYIQGEIPSPLPGTLWQGIRCGSGIVVNVSLVDGRTISYGPCRLPDSIAKLRADSFRLDSVPLLMIKKIAAYVYPEGTTALSFEQAPTPPTSRSLLMIADAIPSPLPHPLHQGRCRLGGGVVVTMYDKTITYGPCRIPHSIDVLQQSMVAAWKKGLP